MDTHTHTHTDPDVENTLQIFFLPSQDAWGMGVLVPQCQLGLWEGPLESRKWVLTEGLPG